MSDGLSVERWLPIDGWPGYEVSDWGHVRSFWGAGSGKQGRRAIGPKSKLIGGFVLQKGHRGVLLYRKQSTEKRRITIHTLVLEAFVGPRPEGLWACHNDGDPANNRVENLRWDTPRSNNRDTLRHGHHTQAVLTEGDIPEIWKRLVAGESDTSIGKDWGVSGVAIGAIRSGRSWAHIAESLPGWPLLTTAQSALGEPVFIDPKFCGHEEIWRSIPDWPPYRVSNHGRVQSCLERAKGIGVGRGSMLLTDKWRDIVLSFDVYGYRIFGACMKGKKSKTLKVHAVVLLAFAGSAPTGFVACHINGDRSDNRAANLRWDTQKKNVADREKHRIRS